MYDLFYIKMIHIFSLELFVTTNTINDDNSNISFINCQEYFLDKKASKLVIYNIKQASGIRLFSGYT